MSSSMLEQAVIDAEALKNAAVKNAEQTILEKYSTEIKDAVTSLLEQEEEDPFAADDEMGMGGEEDTQDREDVVDQLSMSALDGEKLCPCPEDDEPIELDLDQLIAAAEGEEEAAEMEMGMEAEPADTEEELFEVNDDNLLEIISSVLSEEKEEDLSGKQEDAMDADEDGDIDAKDLAALRKADKKKDKPKSEGAEKIAAEIFEDSKDQETSHYITNKDADKKEIEDLEKDERYDDSKEERRDEQSELTDEQLNDILEALVVDLENVPTGLNFHTHPTMGENERGLDVALAQEQDTKFAEEQKELRQALKKLQEQIKSQKLLLNKREKDYKNLKSIALKATKKLEEVNFSNAKLIYTNRILKSDSLNERQKEKLAEAISKVGSVEEAKIVFETLQENLASKGHRAPKTLNEAVISKNNRLILKSNTEKQPASDNQVSRLMKLAGII